MKDDPSQNIWFPIGAIQVDLGYLGTAEQVIENFLSPVNADSSQLYKDFELVHTMRMQVPVCLDFVERILFFTELKTVTNTNTCACSVTNNPSVSWHTFEDIVHHLSSKLYGPEPLIAAAHLIAKGSKAGFPDNCIPSYEISIRKLKDTITTGKDFQLLRSAGFNFENLQMVYCDFVQHSFPSPFLLASTFGDYVTRTIPSLVKEHDVDKLFNSFKRNSTMPYIDFFDYIAGLATNLGTFDLIEEIGSHLLYQSLRFKPNASRPVCGHCLTKKYTLAAHSITVKLDGTISGVDSLANIPDVSRMPKATRVHSDNVFSKTFLPNQMMDLIREHFQKEKTGTSDFSSPMKRERLMGPIKKLCAEAKHVFEKEPRVLQVQSPCYVFGDIHGNLNDLMAYEQMFWPSFPVGCTANYLFLGDYVDRSRYSVHVAIYLIAAKLLAPERIHLLRGNHEVGQINEQFTFLMECKELFGYAGGHDMWQTFNSLFNYFPISAVIDDRIFCAHGGIPATVLHLDKLANSIPCPMDNPLNESRPAWNVLWNDPITMEVNININNLLL